MIAETQIPQALSAELAAAENFRGNVAALEGVQLGLAALLSEHAISGEWVFGRDGYVTLRTVGGWWSGCSVPLAAGREMLKKLELVGSLGCFLKPAHAGQIRACFEKIGPTQAVLAVVPDVGGLKTLLHCDDFSREIRGARLLFVSGEEWAGQLGELFERFSGLSLPQQFIRTPLLDENEMAQLTKGAQEVISRETNRRAERLPEILGGSEKKLRAEKIIVLAGSRFNLADLSNIALRSALLKDGESGGFSGIDTDHPLSASPLALAEEAADAAAVVTGDFFRADLAGVVGPRTAWITWVTTGRIVGPMANCAADGLILADASWREAAINMGWRAERIAVAGWPGMAPTPGDPPRRLGIFCDVSAIEIPQRVKDFSSQLLLWELVEAELLRDPLALGDNPERYLQSRMSKLGSADDGMDRGMFFERLIFPAYKRGVVRMLVNSGVPLAVFGRGWGEIADLKSVWGGAIESVEDLTSAVYQCRAILEAFPDGRSACRALPLGAVGVGLLSREGLVRRVREVLSGKVWAEKADRLVLGRDVVRGLIPKVAN
jgi:hypothetical protein